MKIIAIFVTVLALTLAAPTEETKAKEEKVSVPEKTVDSEKEVEKVELVSESSSDSFSESGEKVADEEPAVKVEKEEKLEEPEIKISEEKAPVIVVATTVKEKEQESNDQVLSDEEKLANYREYSELCRASTGATEEQIKVASKVVEDAPKAVKCYIKCMAEEYGIEKDQVFQKDVARKNQPSSLTEKEIEDVVETCGSLQTDDPCDSAYLRYSCYFRISGEKIRLI